MPGTSSTLWLVLANVLALALLIGAGVAVFRHVIRRSMLRARSTASRGGSTTWIAGLRR